jgi:hypothetical protein
VNKLWQRGSVALMIGLALPVLIAMIALGTEITFLLYKQRQAQSAADAAALGGASALQSGHPVVGVEARAIAGYLGFVDGAADGTTVVVNNPPQSGPQQGSSGAVEVLIAQPQTLVLVKLLYSGQFTVAARAVAIIGSGSYCALQLGGSGYVNISNGVVANLNQCGLAVDGTGSSALTVVGGSQLNAQSVSVAGTASINNGGSINPSSGLKTSQPNIPDPYASVAMPAFSGCNYNGFNTNSWQPSWTLSPGVYCNGLSISNGATAAMNPGVYFIDRGTFAVGGGAHVTGTGVTIVLTSSTGGNYANAVIDNGTTVTLSAPTTGATAGMVFYGDRQGIRRRHQQHLRGRDGHQLYRRYLSADPDAQLEQRRQQHLVELHRTDCRHDRTGRRESSDQLPHRSGGDRRHQQQPCGMTFTDAPACRSSGGRRGRRRSGR